MNIRSTLLFIPLTLFSLNSMSNEMSNNNYKTSALYSPSCNIAQLKALTGEALIKISKQQNWDNNTTGYILTLDLNQMTFGELAKKMIGEKCFTPKTKKTKAIDDKL